MDRECDHILGTIGDYGDYRLLYFEDFNCQIKRVRKEITKEMREDFKYCPDCGKQLYNTQTGEFEWLKEVEE